MTTVARETELDELCINTIRTLAIDAVEKANAGHPGTPMALAPLAYALYTRIMRHNPENGSWPNRDRFVLSNGHASMLLYASLYLSGYPGITLDDIKSFRQLGSPCAGHPEYGDAPGIEATTGPLGQGLSMAVGMALGQRMLGARYNRSGHQLIDNCVFVTCSDGDIEEGITHESSSLAGHLGLGNLIVFYDDNHISIEGDTAIALSEDVGARYAGYGWHVQHLGEDLSPARLEEAAQAGRDVIDRPSLIIIRSHIGYGSPHKQDTGEVHGSPLGVEEARLTKEFYGWPTDPPFLVPEEALAHFREQTARGAELEREWRERFEVYKADYPQEAAELQGIFDRRAPNLPAGLLKRFEPGEKIATRKASSQIIQVAAEHVPWLVGGSADLAPSTLTLIEQAESVSRENYAGRNFHFRDPRARHGRDRQRPLAHRLARVRRDVPDLLRLHEGCDSPGGVDGPAVDVRLHARLDRLGEDGPTQPTDRAARDAPSAAEHQSRAPRGRQRDLARVELRAAPDRYTDRVRAFPPGSADPRSRGDPRGRDRARGLHPERQRRAAAARADRHRLGGLALRGGGGEVARRGDRGYG